MLHVLRHYLPLRKALLIASETVLITLVVMAVMSSHLWEVTDQTRRILATANLDPTDARWRALVSSFLVACLAQFTIAFNELYDFRISSSRYERMARFMTSTGTAVCLLIVVHGLIEVWDVQRVLEFPALPFSQRVVLLTSALFLAFVLLFVWRHVFHLFLRRASFNERLMILGSGKSARRLSDELLTRANSGFDVIALISMPERAVERRHGERRRADDPPSSSTGNPWFEASAARGELALGDGGSDGTESTKVLLAPKLGTSTSEEPAGVRTDEPLHQLVRRLGIDAIIVAFEDRRGSLPIEDLLRCRLEGVVVQEAEAFYERLTGKIPAEAMRPSYLIFNSGFDQHPLSALAKRTVDIMLAALGIALTWPLMVAIAFAIRADSSGPVLFRQVRTGERGRPFTLCKFRSMRADAEKETGPVWASERDPRITRVGHFIRRTRIDELPQLFNVLGGSMSMVGPRPERPTFVEQLAAKIPYYHQRHVVKPGITGWAQINYPYGNTVEDALQKLQYDLFYIKYQSLLFDLSIVFNTVKTVVLRKGT